MKIGSRSLCSLSFLCLSLAATEAISFRAPQALMGDNVDDVHQVSTAELQNLARGIFKTIETNYGPLRLKQTTVGLNWQNAKNKFLNDIKKARTERDFLFQLSSFLFSFNDAHISLQLPSTLTWTLPIQVSYAPETNSYVLNYIETETAKTNLLKGELPPLGAVLVSINGKSTEEFRKSFPYFTSKGNDLTNKSLFGTKLFALSEMSGFPLSDLKNIGWDFEFEWKGADNAPIRKVAKLKYTETGGGIIDINSLLPPTSESLESIYKRLGLNIPQGQAGKDALDKVARQQDGAPYHGQIAAGLASKVNDLFKTAISMDSLNADIPANPAMGASGTRYSIGQALPLFKLPADFSPIELTPDLAAQFDSSQIFAGTFKKNGKRIGLLRIPSYSITEIMIAPQIIDFFVRRLEMSSDYLIIDQMNNPGGAVIYSDFWIQALTGKFNAQKHLQFRVKPTSHFLTQFRDVLASFDQVSVLLPNAVREPLLAEMREQFETIHRAFIAGDDLSQPVSLASMSKYLTTMLDLQKTLEGGPKQGDLFNDQPEFNVDGNGVYTKPIYMIINQFDFSGGDATPATLQDYGRVKLIGTRTAGAGGTVEEFSSRELSVQFIYRLTTSLMFRPGNKQSPYVENYGVQPDISLPATAEDYVNGFATYLDRVVDAAEKDLKIK